MTLPTLLDAHAASGASGKAALQEAGARGGKEAASPVAVPGSLAEVSAAFIERALRRGGALPEGVRVEAVDAEPTAVAGLLSSTGRARLSYAGRHSSTAALPESVIVKLQAENEVNRAVARAADNYAMEANVYKLLAKELPIGLAHCFDVVEDESNGNCVFVLEDLCLRPGINTVAQFVEGGCGQARAEDVAQMMGALHGCYWSWSEPLDSWLRLPSCIAGRNVLQIAAECQEAYLASHYYAELGASARAAMGRATARLPQLAAAVASGPRTLVHLDVRSDNLFWGAASVPGGVILLDWQMVGQGMSLLDLAWFAAGSFLEPGTPDRQARDRSLVEAYWRALTSAGVDGARYPLEAAWRDYLLGITWAHFVLRQAVKFPDCAELTTWLRRASAAAVELGACDVPFERLV